ncbi:hypothetical protein [Corynebacterium caspium]|uniref:hypothetical protein n=1 Tax=Corynebacterium caspium TaxID=234828 RepID=UPI000376A95E|nr:hypothetical protein [Corynebacterium caspium]WKD58583.1 hypothetical protein CCASP_00775 [Corynebacterium caspium DSM 44850]
MIIRKILIAVSVIALGLDIPATASAQIAEQSMDAATVRASTEAALLQPAPGRENLDAYEVGFNDNKIDNAAGSNWEPTTQPKRA